MKEQDLASSVSLLNRRQFLVGASLGTLAVLTGCDNQQDLHLQATKTRTADTTKWLTEAVYPTDAAWGYDFLSNDYMPFLKAITLVIPPSNPYLAFLAFYDNSIEEITSSSSEQGISLQKVTDTFTPDESIQNALKYDANDEKARDLFEESKKEVAATIDKAFPKGTLLQFDGVLFPLPDPGTYFTFVYRKGFIKYRGAFNDLTYMPIKFKLDAPHP